MFYFFLTIFFEILKFTVRAAIFGAAWIVLGKRVWFFPNILAEEATLQELFRFWPKKDEEERPKWTARLFYTIVAVLVILLLRHHAPDEAARARSVSESTSYICLAFVVLIYFVNSSIFSGPVGIICLRI